MNKKVDQNTADQNMQVNEFSPTFCRSESPKTKLQYRFERLCNSKAVVQEWVRDFRVRDKLPLKCGKRVSVQSDISKITTSCCESFYENNNTEDDKISTTTTMISAQSNISYSFQDGEEDDNIAYVALENVRMSQEVFGVKWNDPEQLKWHDDEEVSSKAIQSPVPIHKCKVMYIYSAEKSDELSLIARERFEMASERERHSRGHRVRNYCGEELRVPNNSLEDVEQVNITDMALQVSFSALDSNIKIKDGEVIQTPDKITEKFAPSAKSELLKEWNTQPALRKPILGYCIALFNYDANFPGELSIKEGQAEKSDELSLIARERFEMASERERHSRGHRVRNYCGEELRVPNNSLEDVEQVNITDMALQVSFSALDSNIKIKDGEVIQTPDKITEKFAPSAKSELLKEWNTQPALRKPILGYCIALFNYDANFPGELSIKEGQIIRITSYDAHSIEDGWWTGEVGGLLGNFPSVVVQECIQQCNFPGLVPQRSFSSVDYSFEREDRDVFQILDVINVTSATIAETPSVGVQQPAAQEPEILPTIGYCFALYHYNANSPDELNIEEGEIIRITSRRAHDIDDGWWLGEANGFLGKFSSLIVEECDVSLIGIEDWSPSRSTPPVFISPNSTDLEEIRTPWVVVTPSTPSNGNSEAMAHQPDFNFNLNFNANKLEQYNTQFEGTTSSTIDGESQGSSRDLVKSCLHCQKATDEMNSNLEKDNKEEPLIIIDNEPAKFEKIRILITPPTPNEEEQTKFALTTSQKLETILESPLEEETDILQNKSSSESKLAHWQPRDSGRFLSPSRNPNIFTCTRPKYKETDV